MTRDETPIIDLDAYRQTRFDPANYGTDRPDDWPEGDPAWTDGQVFALHAEIIDEIAGLRRSLDALADQSRDRATVRGMTFDTLLLLGAMAIVMLLLVAM